MSGKHLNSVRGESHHAAKLTEEKVQILRKLHYETGLCKCCSAALVGVNHQTAWDAISYRSWKHVRDA